jgi:hypothetical protein
LDSQSSGFKTTSDQSVNMANMVSSDLIDYSAMTNFNSESVLESGSVVLEQTGNSTMDAEKIAAAREQHYLKEMQKQLIANFSLSTESAMKVAKLTHSWINYLLQES